MMKLENKVAIVTGGTSGIGRASCIKFADEGALVIAVGRKAEDGKNVISEIDARGGKADFYKCDVTSKDDIEALKKYVESKYGRLDILFNNAGMLRTAALEEITDDDWDAMYDTNVKSVMHMCKTFIGMLGESHGVILNNASINGLQHYIKGRKSYMYATTKAACIQFTKYLAKNYAPDIRVNCICPGMTVTNLFTNKDFSRFKGVNLLDRMAEPEEIANAALFLVSNDSSFMTGSVLVVDGGETIN